MDIVWDGKTLLESFFEDDAGLRQRVADAGRAYDWATLLELLQKHPNCVNSTRPGGASWYAPLHQAARGGAPVAVVQELIDLGGWRTLRNARGETPLDIAHTHGHPRSWGVLAPEYKHQVRLEKLAEVQRHFHAVIRQRAASLIEEHQLRLPELEPLLELEEPKMWFPVPGMSGGFSYALRTRGAEITLTTESSCRVVGGSGQRHKITSGGWRLVEAGFA